MLVFYPKKWLNRFFRRLILKSCLNSIEKFKLRYYLFGFSCTSIITQLPESLNERVILFTRIRISQWITLIKIGISKDNTFINDVMTENRMRTRSQHIPLYSISWQIDDKLNENHSWSSIHEMLQENYLWNFSKLFIITHNTLIFALLYFKNNYINHQKHIEVK